MGAIDYKTNLPVVCKKSAKGADQKSEYSRAEIRESWIRGELVSPLTNNEEDIKNSPKV